MRLHEHEALDIFDRYGIPVPERHRVVTAEAAVEAAVRTGFPVVLKAQVLVGGRGLSGGVKFTGNPDETLDAARTILSGSIKGYHVRELLVEPQAPVKNELYFGITVDGQSGCPIAVACASGGVNIEEIAQTAPEKIASYRLDPRRSMMPYEARNLIARIGFYGGKLAKLADVMTRLGQVFYENDAVIVEINPIAVLDDGAVMALDAVLEIDDSALYRLKDAVPDDIGRIENPLERRGSEIGVTYVDLDGDIGIIASGAGLGMATMDIIAGRHKPANFLETGGGITDELLYDTMDLMMRKDGLRAIFINIYGGINPIHEGAKGVVRYIREHDVTIPVVAKALGNRQEETWEIFREGGVHVVTDVSTEHAVDVLSALLEMGVG